MYLEYYKNMYEVPYFLKKYLKCPSLLRLKDIGYFCGMDYASKNIYSFREKITRLDHSLTVALLTYKLTKNKKATLAGLFHDVSTPCFSHVIDYMNKDYLKQESTEEYIEEILNNDKYLKRCLKKDKILLNDIVDFKKYTIVDSKRPKLCADRIDGIILNGTFWSKSLEKEDIKKIINDLRVYQNEDKEKEIGFKSIDIANLALKVNKEIDILSHSKEDNYMMELLAKITKKAIDDNYITYKDLYKLNEKDLYNIYEKINNIEFKQLFTKFKTIKQVEIEDLNIKNIKRKTINPLVNGKRLLK
ncbi:MAG: HD domain-containing protein [Bacilli bacterium]|nr:HD domain-containing protein [Bacilli bacterium]